MRTPSLATPASPLRRSGGGLQAWLARTGAAMVSALQSVGAARARSELLAHAERCEPLQPRLAAELRAAGARLALR